MRHIVWLIGCLCACAGMPPGTPRDDTCVETCKSGSVCSDGRCRELCTRTADCGPCGVCNTHGLCDQGACDTNDPATGSPTSDSPDTDDQPTDSPATDNPTTDDPAADNPTTDNPAADNPAADDPTAGNPATGNPGADAAPTMPARIESTAVRQRLSGARFLIDAGPQRWIGEAHGARFRIQPTR